MSATFDETLEGIIAATRGYLTVHGGDAQTLHTALLAAAASVPLTVNAPADSQGAAITSANGGGTAHAHALTANLTGSGNAFASAANLVSSNPAASCVQVSGVETGRGSVKITHTGPGDNTDANASAISIDLQGAGTACQGIHIDASAGGTTGALLDIRNNGSQLLKVLASGAVVLGNGGPQILFGAGAPLVAAPVGSTYQRSDGGTSTSFYVKESGTGTAGWVAK